MPAAKDTLITPDRYRTTNGESIDYEEFRRFALHAKVNASPDARLNNFHIDELWSLACARKVQPREWEPFINSLEQEFDAAAAKCVQFPAPPPDVRKALSDAATYESPAPSLAAVISHMAGQDSCSAFCVDAVQLNHHLCRSGLPCLKVAVSCWNSRHWAYVPLTSRHRRRGRI